MKASLKLQAMAFMLVAAFLTTGLFACRKIIITDIFTSPVSFFDSYTGGLAYTDDLWLAGGDVIWRIDAVDGQVKEFIDAPGDTIIGLAPGDGHLWAVAAEPDNASELSAHIARLYKLKTTGEVIGSFIVPSVFYPQDIAFDGTWLWLVSGFNGKIYKIDTEGTIVDSFFASGVNPDGLTYDGSHLWVSDSFSSSWISISKLDTSGTVIDSFCVPGVFSFGLACDGENSLWISVIVGSKSLSKIYRARIPDSTIKSR